MQKPWKGNWSRKYFWVSNDRLVVRSELILILNSTWTNQITHCRELVNLFSAKRKLNWRPKKGDSPKIYIKQKNPLLLGPHCGQSVSEAPFEFFLQICGFKKLLIPLCTLLAFVMETFHSRIWRPETLYFMLFSYRVIMYTGSNFTIFSLSNFYKGNWIIFPFFS